VPYNSTAESRGPVRRSDESRYAGTSGREAGADF